MFERFTDRARKVFALANQEAQRFNHEYIGTEHILLGLIKEGSGVAANVLKNMKIDLRKIRLEVEKLVKPGPEMVTMGKLPKTPRTQKLIDHAIEDAKDMNNNYVGTEHILLGMLHDADSIACNILMNLGVSTKKVHKAILDLLGIAIKPGITVQGKQLCDAVKTPSCEPRESIKNFAQHMESALVENEHKGGWQGCEMSHFIKCLKKQLQDLMLSLADRDNERITKEAADIANFCMMISEKANRS